VKPRAPARYEVQFAARAELHNELGRLRDLMRSSVPDGDLAKIIESLAESPGSAASCGRR
jgi:hypothetical protein